MTTSIIRRPGSPMAEQILPVNHPSPVSVPPSPIKIPLAEQLEERDSNCSQVEGLSSSLHDHTSTNSTENLVATDVAFRALQQCLVFIRSEDSSDGMPLQALLRECTEEDREKIQWAGRQIIDLCEDPEKAESISEEISTAYAEIGFAYFQKGMGLGQARAPVFTIHNRRVAFEALNAIITIGNTCLDKQQRKEEIKRALQGCTFEYVCNINKIAEELFDLSGSLDACKALHRTYREVTEELQSIETQFDETFHRFETKARQTTSPVEQKAHFLKWHAPLFLQLTGWSTRLEQLQGIEEELQRKNPKSAQKPVPSEELSLLQARYSERVSSLNTLKLNFS